MIKLRRTIMIGDCSPLQYQDSYCEGVDMFPGQGKLRSFGSTLVIWHASIEKLRSVQSMCIFYHFCSR